MNSVITKRPRYTYNVLLELAALATLSLVTFMLLKQYSPLGTLNDRLDVDVRYAIVLSPVIMTYLFTRTLCHRSTSLLTVLFLQIIILFVNSRKISETNEVLSWGDFTRTENLGVAMQYMDWLSYVVIFGGTLLLLFAWIRASKKKRTGIGSRIVFFTLGLLFTPLAIPQYISGIAPRLSSYTLEYYNNNIDEYYISYNWNNNQNQNGIYTHLIQTSLRPVPPSASSLDKSTFADLSVNADNEARPDHIIFILCEACWHDDDHFTDVFQPLRDAGMVEFRGISPVYGGGTANAEFEMYTGLSSRTVLQGVIFQEYATNFSSNAETIVSSLQKKGYHTMAFHNFLRKFWRRDVVFEKFGFNLYHGIEDMTYDKANQPYFPEDSIVFDHALKQIRANIDRPFFANLLTVSTHGGYSNDITENGTHDYKERLTLAISETAGFVREVKKLNPNALIVLYGDHKPNLTDFFYEEGILDPNYEHQASIGDVPIYIGYSDDSVVNQIKELANNKPFYCVSAVLDTVLIKSGAATTRFAFNEVCRDYSEYYESFQQFPDWIYRLSLFD